MYYRTICFNGPIGANCMHNIIVYIIRAEAQLECNNYILSKKKSF